MCCDISSCQGNGVSNREKLNFEKVFLSLFLPGAEGGRRWAISAIPMKNTENTNNNKKQKKIYKIPKTGGRARSFADASTWGAPSVEIIGEASKNYS